MNIKVLFITIYNLIFVCMCAISYYIYKYDLFILFGFWTLVVTLCEIPMLLDEERKEKNGQE